MCINTSTNILLMAPSHPSQATSLLSVLLSLQPLSHRRWFKLERRKCASVVYQAPFRGVKKKKDEWHKSFVEKL